MAITKELSEQIKISQAISPTDGAAGATPVNGKAIDMSNHEGVLMTCTFGAITTGAVTSIKAQQGDQSDGSDMQDLAGTGQSVPDSRDNNIFFINLHKPRKRYVRLVVVRGTQNAVVAAADYKQYGARTLSVPAHGTEVAGESHVSPPEGTP